MRSLILKQLVQAVVLDLGPAWIFPLLCSFFRSHFDSSGSALLHLYLKCFVPGELRGAPAGLKCSRGGLVFLQPFMDVLQKSLIWSLSLTCLFKGWLMIWKRTLRGWGGGWLGGFALTEANANLLEKHIGLSGDDNIKPLAYVSHSLFWSFNMFHTNVEHPFISYTD